MKLIFTQSLYPCPTEETGVWPMMLPWSRKCLHFLGNLPLPRSQVADSIVRIHRTNSIVQIPLCNSTMRVSSSRCYCACSFMHIPLFPSSAFYQRHPIVRMRILSRAFYRADSIVRISSCGFYCADYRADSRIILCGFYRADSIVRIPSWGLSCGLHCANSIVRIIVRTPFCGFHRADSFICLLSSAFHSVHYIVCIPSCAFHRVHSIVRKEEVNEDGGGTWAHRVQICIASP